MTGLSLMNRLMDPDERPAVAEEHAPAAMTPAPKVQLGAETTRRSSKVRDGLPPVPAPYRDRIVREVPQLEEVWSYLNPQMLYVKHMGFRGNFQRRLAERDPKAIELNAIMEDVKAEAAAFMKVRAVWQFFDADGAGNTLRIFPPGEKEALHAFKFPRQRREDGLCLADYVLPGNNGTRDSIALFAVSSGEGIRERAEQYKQDGEYLKSHAVQALALETAEACAECCTGESEKTTASPTPREQPCLTASRRNTGRAATVSAMRLVPTWKTSRLCSVCCAPRKSASSSPRAA